MAEEDDPFLEAMMNIDREESNDNQTQNILTKINQENDSKKPGISLQEENENSNINPLSNNNANINDQNQNLNSNNDSPKINQNQFLNKKTKANNELFNNENNNNIQNDEKKNNDNENQHDNNSEIFDYGYTISLINDGETGLMEDFLKEKQNEPTTSDFFNYHLDEEKWIKILNHSILIHYERHLKEEMEKKKKIQNNMNNMMMYMNQGRPGNMMNPMMMAANMKNMGMYMGGFPMQNFPMGMKNYSMPQGFNK